MYTIDNKKSEQVERRLSKRLSEVLLALPLSEGIRVLEIGCGPGAMAREILQRIGNGHILAIDRSARAIEQAMKASKKEVATGQLQFRQAAIENFKLLHGEVPFNIAIAVRVGGFDGRHPEIEKQSLINVAKSLTDNGRFFIDGGNPLKEIPLDAYREMAAAGNW